MLTRQAEGIIEAKKRGVKFGRPKKHPPPNYPEIKRKYQAKTISSRKAAELLKVSQRTFLDWIRN
jgi:DNA invertase Pin-like site-specific DNA recombinase